MRAATAISLSAAAILALALPGAPAAAGAAGDPGTAALQAAWRADLGRALGTELARLPGGIAVTTLERRCALLDAATGRRLWTARESDGVGGGLGVSAAGLVGVTDPPGQRLFCRDAETGRLLWRRPWTETIGAPVSNGATVFVAGLSGRVAACDGATGETLWEYRAPGLVRSRLGLAGSLLLVPTTGDTLIALATESGEVRWGAAPGGALYGPPLEQGGRLYTLSGAGALRALDAVSGERLAGRDLPGFFRSGLAGGSPLVAVSTGGRVFALRAEDLAVLWERDCDQAAEIEPRVHGGLVWIGLRDGRVLGLDASSGEARYELRVTAPVRAPILADASGVFVGAGGGEVVAYRWLAPPGDARPSGACARRAPPQTPGQRPRGGEAHFRWGCLTLASADLDAAAPAGVSGRAARPLCRTEASPPARGLSRWRWPATLAWGVCTALAFGLQDRADREYGLYLSAGSPGTRERALAASKDYDRAVIGAWLAAEVSFAVGVKAWLDSRAEGEAP